MRLTLFVVLLLLAPTASAAMAWEMDVTQAKHVRIRGPLHASANEGTAVVPCTALSDAQVSWVRATGSLVERRRRNVAGMGPTMPESQTTALSYGPGELVDLAGEGDCVLLFFSNGGGILRYEGAVEELISPASEARSYWAGSPEPADRRDAFARQIPAGSYWLGSTHAADGSGSVEGTVGVLLWHIQGTIRAEGEDHEFWTGSRSSSSIPGAQQQIEDVTSRFILLELEGAHASAADLDIAASRLSIHTSEEWTAWDANGWIRVGHRRTQLDAASISANGQAAFDLTSSQGALFGHGILSAHAAGEARSVRVNGANAMPVLGPPEPAAATGPGLLGLLLIVTSGLAIRLYSRFSEADALAHPTRRALFDWIRSKPGLDVTALGVALDLPRPVVRHHLAMMERQRLAVASRVGRSRRYFPSGSNPATASQEEVLRDPSRLAVASVIARAGSPLSQSEIMAATKLSRRVVSYHLQRLSQAGLVSSGGAFPLRYSPREASALPLDFRSGGLCGLDGAAGKQPPS